MTEDQRFGAMCRSSAIFWEEEGGENQVISMNAQVAQSLSMAITSHCVVEHSHCSKHRTRETKDGPGRAGAGSPSADSQSSADVALETSGFYE